MHLNSLEAVNPRSGSTFLKKDLSLQLQPVNLSKDLEPSPQELARSLGAVYDWDSEDTVLRIAVLVSIQVGHDIGPRVS